MKARGKINYWNEGSVAMTRRQHTLQHIFEALLIPPILSEFSSGLVNSVNKGKVL